LRLPWIPQIGATFHLAADGLSLILLLLTAFLGVVAVVASWTVRQRVGFFHLNLMLVLAGVAGVFMALGPGPVPAVSLLGINAGPDVLPH